MELTERKKKILRAIVESYIRTAGLIWPLFYTAVFYLAFCGLLTLLFGAIEKKLSYFKA